MREIRQSGSEGGVVGNGHPYPYGGKSATLDSIRKSALIVVISRIPSDASTAASDGSESPFLTLRDQPMKQVINNPFKRGATSGERDLGGQPKPRGPSELEFQQIPSIK